MEQSITVEELQNLCADLFAKRKAYEDQKEITKKLLEDYEAEERKVVEVLQALEMKSFTSTSGKLELREVKYYQVPKNPEDKTAIRKYMEDRGIFENYWSIHSQSFNAWVKEEGRIAKEEGKFLSIPGVSEPTVRYDLAMKKLK